MNPTQTAESSSGPVLPVYGDHQAACDLLGISRDTLRKLMVSTPAHIQRPWVNIGVGVRPTYRWNLVDVPRWLQEVDAWRTSQEEERSGQSVGTRTDDNGNVRALIRGQRSSSRPKSSERKPLDTDGVLKTLRRRSA